MTEIRSPIAQHCEAQPPFEGEVEVGEKFSGARRIKVKRGRGALGKAVVFGIFKRNGRVNTKVVPDRREAALQVVIRGRVYPGVPYTGMDGAATMGLYTSGTRSITVLTTETTNLPGARLISSESRVSGVEAVAFPDSKGPGLVKTGYP